MILAVANQKGGVGKTTSVLNIGAGLAKNNQRVLLVDADPQNHLSRWLGYTKPDGNPTISDLIYQEVSHFQSDFPAFIRHNESVGVDYIPSNNILSGILAILGVDPDSQNVFTRLFRKPFFDSYDFIIFDCQPSLDLLVANILKASDTLLVPVQPDMLSYEGVGNILSKYIEVKQIPPEELKQYVLGLLVTMYQGNTSIAREVREALKANYDGLVLEPPIPYRVEAKNSSATREALAGLKKNSAVGEAYMQIAEAILRRKEEIRNGRK